MDESELDWAEFLRILGPLPEKGPLISGVAKAEALEIMASYHRRRAERAAGQTYALRRARLSRIEKAADELVEALVEAGSECHEELRVVGGCFPAPRDWSSKKSWLSDLADLRITGLWNGVEGLESSPILALRVSALRLVAEKALANTKLASRPGKGVKPSTIDEASPAMHLVNDCWNLLVKLKKRPSSGLGGRLNLIALELGSLATQEEWKTDRLKREVAHVVKLRRAFDKCERAFEEAWTNIGSPLIRGPLEVDRIIEQLAGQLNELITGSEGLLVPSRRLVAWKAFSRLKRTTTGSEQNPT